jgi:hypothetical protein
MDHHDQPACVATAEGCRGMEISTQELAEVFDRSQVTRDDKTGRTRTGPRFAEAPTSAVPWEVAVPANTCHSGWEKPQHA